MKTAILQLDPHDDAISTCDHLAWVQAERALLVCPGRSPLHESRLDLTLIYRRAQEMGLEIAVVAHKGRVREYARELGIPVFRRVKLAQKTAWRKPRPARRSLRWFDPFKRADVREMKESLPRDRSPKWNGMPRVGVFSLGVLAVMAMLVFFLPGAEVSFTPALETQSLTLSLRADPNLTTPTLSGGLPVRSLTVIVEGQEQGEASGWNTTPLQTASGNVVFTNLTDAAVTVPVGTVVRTAEEPFVRFETVRAGTIRGEPGATLTVPVKAQQPGKAGNAPAESIQVVEGSVGSKVSVTNRRAITGGTDRSTRAPSEADYRQLESALMKSLEATAADEFETLLGPFDQILPETLRAVAILKSDRDPAVGAAGERITLRMQVEFEVWAVDTTHIEAIANAGFHPSLPAGYQVVPDSFRINRIEPAPAGSSGLPLRVEVERQIHAGWSEPALVRAIMGARVSEVARRLNAVLPLEGEPAVQITPSWWQRMPFLSFRIELEAR